MSLQVEKLEKNMAKLTIEVPAEELEAAIEKAYQKNKGKIQIPGFRKGSHHFFKRLPKYIVVVTFTCPNTNFCHLYFSLFYIFLLYITV